MSRGLGDVYKRQPDVPYTDPCCTQDGGVLQDYTVDLSGASSIQNIQSDSFVVYPNPTEGELSVNLEDASEYMLYSIDGRLVQKGIVDRNVIDVTGNASGMYILKVKSGAEIKCVNIIIK